MARLSTIKTLASRPSLLHNAHLSMLLEFKLLL
jgi:hypothetical protein